ncbi:hypothetical protein ABW19_dt0202360 [Dactylella cylindrospora]|nr:hypothetical protein ABW19_dt0202360 [Dactylella cylindrospora]
MLPFAKSGIAEDASGTKTPTKYEIPRMAYMIPEREPIFNYSVVRDIFAQSLPEYLIDEHEFNENYKVKNFGLLLHTPNDEPDWKAFVEKVKELNSNAEPDVTYKVLYLARHGEVKTWGHPMWDRELAVRNEYEGLVYGPDPDLTETGKGEAREINQIWKTQITKYGLYHAGAMPQRFYCSPFTRAVRTLEKTWDDIVLNLPDAPRVAVRENFRETIGRHSCDKRGKMSVLKEKFQFVDVEEGMADGDEIWTEIREDETEPMDARLRYGLDNIFLEAGETFISITAHSGCLRSVLRVVGHRLFTLETSKMIPVIVKAQIKPEFKGKYKFPAAVEGLPYAFPDPFPA